MVGDQERQAKWVMVGSLRKLIPDDHILARVDRVLDLSWLREEVGATYSRDQGRPSIPPETALRLMVAGFFQNLVHDRALLREAQVNLAIRWFAGYQLDDRLPDHSSLTRIRQRWGEARFKRIFQRTVEQCARAGLVSGETLHVDATLIRADVSWESLTTDYATRVLAANAEADKPPPPGGRPKKRSKTDPDASLTTSRNDQRMEPSYKQHTAVDDRAGVIVGVQLTTGEQSEGRQLPEVLREVVANTGRLPATLTADGGYAHSANYQHLEAQGIAAVIPPQPLGARSGRLPLARFKYDGMQQTVRCPGGARLPRVYRDTHGWVHRASARDCRGCRWRAQCVRASVSSRTVVIVDGYESLLRARRRRRRWGAVEHGLYARHRWRVEGAHAEAKTRHGLRRAVRRGLGNVAIQVYLTAAVMNLKRLAALFGLFFGVPGLLGALRHVRRCVVDEISAFFADQACSEAHPACAAA